MATQEKIQEILDETQNVVLATFQADFDRILSNAEQARREYGFRKGDTIAVIETTYELTISNEPEYRYGFTGQTREIARRKPISHRVVVRYELQKTQGQWRWRSIA